METYTKIFWDGEKATQLGTISPEAVKAVMEYRKTIIKLLEKEVAAEACDCGLLCEGWGNGMEYAIDIIKGEK